MNFYRGQWILSYGKHLKDQEIDKFKSKLTEIIEASNINVSFNFKEMDILYNMFDDYIIENTSYCIDDIIKERKIILSSYEVKKFKEKINLIKGTNK